jgi:hypothetical protein
MHESHEHEIRSLQQVSALHIIRDQVSQCAVVDLETRLLEAGLASVTISDPWNFGHGRYMSLLTPRISTGVILVGNWSSGRALGRIATSIPQEIPRLRIEVPADTLGDSLMCWFRVMWFIDTFADARGVDPAQLKATRWGDSLYLDRLEH